MQSSFLRRQINKSSGIKIDRECWVLVEMNVKKKMNYRSRIDKYLDKWLDDGVNIMLRSTFKI